MRTQLLRSLLMLTLVVGLAAPAVTFAQDDGSITVGDTVSIDTDGVNIRDEFGTDGEVITNLEIGTTLEILDGPETADGYTWWLGLILDEDSVDQGISGWLVEDYLTLDDVETPPDDDETNTPTPTATSTSTTPTPTATPDDSGTEFGTAGWVEVKDGPLNVREEPGTDADILESLQTGAFATVVDGSDIETADSYNWIEVETASGTKGWIATAFLDALDEDPCADDACEVDDPLLNAAAVEVIDGPLNIRTEATTSGDILDSLATGSILNVWSPASLEAGDDLNWLSVDFNGEQAFVAVDFITETDVTCDTSPCVVDEAVDDDPFAIADDVVVTDGPLNLRAEPGTDGEVLEVLDVGDSVPTVSGEALITADGYTWVKVSRLSGTPREGWLATDFLAVGEGDGGTSTGGLDAFADSTGSFVTDGPLNLRDNPDTGADVLLRLETGDYVWIDSISASDPWEADGFTWIRVTVAGEIGYVAIDFITPAD